MERFRTAQGPWEPGGGDLGGSLPGAPRGASHSVSGHISSTHLWPTSSRAGLLKPQDTSEKTLLNTHLAGGKAKVKTGECSTPAPLGHSCSGTGTEPPLSLSVTLP